MGRSSAVELFLVQATNPSWGGAGKELLFYNLFKMSQNSETTAKDLFTGITLLAGIGVAFLLLWAVSFLLIAGLIFLGLTVFTDWNLGVRIGFSLISTFFTLKIVRFVFETLDLIPDSWIDSKKETKPCPECGKNLRTALAQQCMHCGADWHT